MELLLLKTLVCWLIAYFSSIFFFVHGFVSWIRDKGSLQGHYHHGSRLWAKMMLKLTGIKVLVKNPEALEEAQRQGGPYIVASNHGSVVDILVLLHVIPFQFVFFTKRTLFFIPIYGWYLWAAGYIPVNRQDPRSAYRSIESAAKKIERGVSLVIFPEGSRSQDGRLGRFKSGFIRVAEMTGAKILPVAISGSHEIVPKGSILMKPSKVSITIGKAMKVRPETLHDRDQRMMIVDNVRENVAAMLEEARK